jgi:hypothetical protein
MADSIGILWDKSCKTWSDMCVIWNYRIFSTIWGTACYKWGEYCILWSDCIDVVKEVVETPGGAARPPEEMIEVYERLDTQKKRKVIRLILWLKGNKIIQEKEIKNYKISIEDVELLTKEYKKAKQTIEIKVSDIKII